MHKNLHGAAEITHRINEYGGNRGMVVGLAKLANDSQRIGYQKALSDIQHSNWLSKFMGNIKFFGR